MRVAGVFRLSSAASGEAPLMDDGHRTLTKAGLIVGRRRDRSFGRVLPRSAKVAAAAAAIAGLGVTPASAFDLVNTRAGLITHPGAGPGGADASRVQNATLMLRSNGFSAADSAGFTVADDFTLTEPAVITGVTAFAYQTESSTTSTLNHFAFRIWNGDPLVVGSAPIAGDLATNRLTATAFTGIYRDLETMPGDGTRPVMSATAGGLDIALPAGTYWLEVQIGGLLSSGPWVPPLTLLGAVSFPGANGRQFRSSWNPIDDTQDGDQPQGLPFQVTGTMAPAPATGVVTSVRTTSVTLSGTVHPRGLATAYHVEYGPPGAPSASTAVVPVPAGDVVVPVAVAIGGLKPRATYRARLVAENAMGRVVGAETTFTTLRTLTLGRLTLVPAGIRSGTASAVRFALSDRARVTVVVDRMVPGRRKAGRCRPTARTGPRCSIFTRRGTIAVAKAAGSAVRIRVPARLGGRALAPGRYRVTVIARDAATGRVSNFRRAVLTVRP